MSKDLEEFDDKSFDPNEDSDDELEDSDEFDSVSNDGTLDEDLLKPSNQDGEEDDIEEDDDEDDDTKENEKALEINISGIGGEYVGVTGYVDKQYVGKQYNKISIPRKAETFFSTGIHPEKIKRISEVYVGNEVFINPSSLVQKRLVIVYGKPYTSRYTSCVLLANKYKTMGLVKEIRYLACTAKSSLISFLLDKTSPSNCAFILRNGFGERGIYEQEVIEAYSEIIHLLQEQNSFLLITSDISLDLPSSAAQIKPEPLSVDQKSQVIRNYLGNKIYELSSDLLDAVKKEVPKLSRMFESGYQIDQFLLRVSESKISVQGIIEEAEKVIESTAGIDKWFENLGDKLTQDFAITVALFPDLDANRFLKRLDADILFRRQKGEQLSTLSDSDRGLNHFLQLANCQLSDWGTIEFKNPFYASKVLEQFRKNYRFRFWQLSEVYLREIEKYHSKKEILLRISYAKALGEILASDEKVELEKTLAKLGSSKYPSVRAATGYVLKHIYYLGATKLVDDILIKWSRSSSWRLKWTSLAAGERLYSYLPETVSNIMNYHLIDADMHEPLNHSVLSIARIRLGDMVRLLINWLQTNSSKKSVVQQFALDTAFEIIKELDVQDNNRIKTILPLVSEILQIADGRLEMLSVIKDWLVYGLSEEAQSEIKDILANQLLKGDSESGVDFQRIIFTEWIKDDTFTLNEIAHSLLDFLGETHMQAQATPTSKKGVMILDISSTEENTNIIKSFSRAIGQKLSLDISWKYYYLGISQEINADNPETELFELQHSHTLKLIGPILDKLDDEIDIVLVLASGKILDLADWINSKWKNKLVVDFLIGNGEQVPQLVCVSTNSEAGIEEILNKVMLIQEQPITRKTNVSSKRKSTSDYRIDKTGYPLIFMPTNQVYVHVLPITKIQFEKFLCSSSNISDDHQYYLKMLNESPRISPSEISPDTFWGLFATAVRPLDAISFAKWLGEFDLPTVDSWRACYLYLDSYNSKDVLSDIMSDKNLNQFAKATLEWLLAQNNAASMLELTLMNGGFLEWVYTNVSKTSWGGFGKPNIKFYPLITNPLKEDPHTPIGNDFNKHIRHYGFRLISK